MDPLLAALLGAVVGAIVAIAATALVMRSRARAAVMAATALAASQLEAAVATERAVATAGLAEREAELAGLAATVDGLREQIEAARLAHTELIARGDKEAAERRQREQSDAKVLQALSPVQETLRTMQAKVTELETQRSQQHGELTQQLRAATEGEERLRATAESLAAALKNNAVRGVWGETQLRTLVESAGLLNHVDFDEQSTIQVGDTARRPDMIIRLPGGKQIAVDSKVPYNDYIEAAAIPASAIGDDDNRRKELLARHAKRVKSHVDALSARGYWSGLDASPDFTIAFIPNEALLATALEADPGLMEYSFSKGVVLASPVSFWAALKTVAFTWRQDVLTEDAKRLFDLSRELYGRLATLASHADSLRKSIDGTVASYNAFASSLETRVLVTARKLGDLDETKLLAQPQLVDERPKQLTAPELTAQLPLDLAIESADD